MILPSKSGRGRAFPAETCRYMRCLAISNFYFLALSVKKLKKVLMILLISPQAAQALFMNHTRIEHNMASNYKGLYGIFYKIIMKVVKSVNIQ